ncbi:hypothetical protein CBOM_06038 [Ceraceosorus bombacis]|uniref:Uncharacterized protein n=1 Tax=Ceraceosorus bombacis TaxID=401625 RepID=A0A0P1BJ74_9BASI|nr:hypothetical protein CBOM_06038 [Ceraceosorus bombacis]
MLAAAPLIVALPPAQQPGDYDAALRKALLDPASQLGAYLKNSTQTLVSGTGNSWADTVYKASPEARKVTLPKQPLEDLRNAIQGIGYAGSLAENRGYIFQPDDADRAFTGNWTFLVYQQFHHVLTESLFVERANKLEVQSQIVGGVTQIRSAWKDAWPKLFGRLSDKWESKIEVGHNVEQFDQWFSDILKAYSK